MNAPDNQSMDDDDTRADFASYWIQVLSGPWAAAKVLVQDDKGGDWRELVTVE